MATFRTMEPGTLHLHLLRHADAAWGEGVADADRSLSPAGRQAATRLDRALDRRWLEVPTLRPELALVSPVRRTRETLRCMPAALGGVDTRMEDRLWGATPDSVLDLLRELSQWPGSVLVLGHEPWLGGLARLLAPSSGASLPTGTSAPTSHTGVDGRAGRPGLRPPRNVPTATLLTFRLSVPLWARLDPGQATFVEIIGPHDELPQGPAPPS